MKIQAISPMMSAVGCQPIKPVKFGRNTVPQEFLKNQTFNDETDSFSPKETLQQKYDLACRIAAYYKTKYEALLAEGNCLA